MASKHNFNQKHYNMIREVYEDLIQKKIKKSYIYRELKNMFAEQIKNKTLRVFDIMCYYQMIQGKAKTYDEAIRLAGYIAARRCG